MQGSIARGQALSHSAAHRNVAARVSPAAAAAAAAAHQRRRRAASAAAATSAVPAATADDKQVFKSLLPPTGAKPTTLVEIKPGKLWALRQPFPEDGAASIWLNCSVAALSGGDLLVYAPVAPTREALDMVASLPGRVAHIVAPSLSPEHWLYVNAFAAAHPDAAVWACPGLTEVNLPGIGDAKIAAGPRVRAIGPELTAALGGELDFALFEGPFGLFKEAVFYARGAGAVFSGDLFFGAFEDEGMPTALQRRIGDLVGIRKRLGCPVAFLQMLFKPEQGRAFVSKVKGWDFDTVTGGHLSAGINAARYGVDGKQAFVDCFKFVKSITNMVIFDLSTWIRRKTASRRFWSNMATFFLLQGLILALRHRLASQAPALEPPLDYRPHGYTEADAVKVMRSYPSDARATAVMLELTDCLYSAAYAALFAGLLGIALGATGARAGLHAVNLVPAATACVDIVENLIMVALLLGSQPAPARLAGAAVAASAVKWRMLMVTASLVAGTGAYTVVTSLTGRAGAGARARRRGGAADKAGDDDGGGSSSKVRGGGGGRAKRA